MTFAPKEPLESFVNNYKLLAIPYIRSCLHLRWDSAMNYSYQIMINNEVGMIQDYVVK